MPLITKNVVVSNPTSVKLSEKATIGNTLRLMVAGDDEITTYREAGEQYPVTVRVLESQRRDINMIGKLTVTSASGQPVRIDNIARLERGFGPTRISRSNRQYSINIGADTAPGHALDESSGDLRRIITEAQLPPGYTFQMRGQTQNLDETTDNLMLALLLASIFVYMVLAAQFESFVQPLVIMTVLPLSIPFALFTILATGRTLNLWSALGILLLFGIVKKNSILQVDYTNVLRARGVPRDEAIVDACRTRLRPILMTTLAIIFGLLPTALGVGIGGAQRSAIAVTIIGAQSLCLFLTLLLVPAAYVKLDGWSNRLRISACAPGCRRRAGLVSVAEQAPKACRTRTRLAIHRPFTPGAPASLPRDRVGARGALQTGRGRISLRTRCTPRRRVIRGAPGARCRRLRSQRSTWQTNMAVRAVLGTGFNGPPAQGAGYLGHISGYPHHGASAGPVSGPGRAVVTPCGSPDRTVPSRAMP